GGRGTDGLRQTYGAPLRVLMAMVGLMLLIAIANVATLLLARMVRRRREMAVRVALGVSRARLARQLLTEGLLLSVVAGAAAVLVAVGTSQGLVRLAANGGSAPFRPDLDWRVWAFLAAVSLLVGVVLGALPAWAAQRGNFYAELKGGGSSASGAGRVPLGRWLVVAQVALSLLLVVGAGLFSRSLAGMVRMDMGFDRNRVLSLELEPPNSALPPATLAALQQKMLERIEAMPGVRAAALTLNGIDDGSAETSGISFAGRAQPRDQDQAREDSVSQHYFAAVGMRIVQGRGFGDSDGPHTTKVVVINQSFAQRYYPEQDALGQTFGYNPKSTGDFHVVGVVADARLDDPTTPAVPLFYHLLSQTDRTAMRLEVGTAADPLALAAALRQAVAETAAPLQVGSSFSLAERIGHLLGEDRMVAELSAGFGGLALALACLGLYGVMAYAVAARGGEFGIRVALGASRGQVVGLVLKEVALLLGGGVALGLPLALAAGRWLQPLLPGVRATDPVTLAGAALVMAGLPMLVALHPAWRAAQADPTRALRAE
ncbi:MAG TPA: FtsX-like permease family protein, partial [Terriglobales bacterium]|nr:FtsX-like permease family protein [Terriglobales bacterium]